MGNVKNVMYPLYVLEAGSFRPESRSPGESFRPDSLSPSFINSAFKNEIWKIPLQIFVFWMLQGLFMGTLF